MLLACLPAEFIERMELRYSAAAAASGALIASAAGFDSVPADMGCLFAQLAFAPPAVPSSVEAVITVHAPLGTQIHYATW
jgi:saccharopine dehydrogenase (NAD+, L-glutamate forming)